MTEREDETRTLADLAFAAGPPVELIGDEVLQVAAQIDDEFGGVEAHLRDTARELLALRRERDQALRALLAEFVPALEHAECPSLWAAVEHACVHHGWHHDAASVSYAERDAALAALELEAEGRSRRPT